MHIMQLLDLCRGAGWPSGHALCTSTIESGVVHELRKRFQKTQIVHCGKESGPRGELCLAEMMRFVGLEELDGCGMARSRSESTIPCN